MKPGLMELIAERVVIFDGGMGSMLIAEGLKETEVPESWIFSNPDGLGKIHEKYIEAGADVIQTNTFGASRVKMASSKTAAGLDPVETNRRAALLVREAMKKAGAEERLVAGDIGPTGRFFAPVGDLTPKEARETFREQAEALAEGGVDLFLIETMSDVREAVEAPRAVKEAASLPAVVELTYQKKPRGYFTLMGNSPREAAPDLEKEGADMIGANCSLSSGEMIELVSELRKVAKVPLLFQPNAGQPVIDRGRPRYRQTPEEFASDMLKMVKAGAGAVGGCCGTNPSFIKLLRERILG